MICIKIEYYSENKELISDLVNILNKTIHNFCVDRKETFVALNNMSVIGIPVKVIE